MNVGEWVTPFSTAFLLSMVEIMITEYEIFQAARVAHEVNRAYCQAIGDTSQVSWEDAPDWQKDSAVAGVRAHVADPSLTPEQSHQKWYDHKKKEGWTYGRVKDADKKEHPCMVSYAKLPLEQRIKDHLFKAVVAQICRHEL